MCMYHVPDGFEPETLRSVVKRDTSEPRLQLSKCLQIFAIYALTLVMYTVAIPGSMKCHSRQYSVVLYFIKWYLYP